MVLAISVLDKFKRSQELLEIKSDELESDILDLLKKNGWKPKKTSNNSPTIDVVYMNKKNTAWVWKDTKLNQWFYSDNPQNKNFDGIEDTKITRLIKSLS